MQDISPESPEERAKQPEHVRAAERKGRAYALTIAKRVGIGVYNDGFIHAGNLAYLALVTLFPFFIVAAAIAQLLGRTEDGLKTVTAFLRTVPPGVAEVLQQPINDVLTARSGSLLWLGAAVGLWTTGSFIETIRDILRRAYGVKYSRPFWEYRLGSAGMIVGAVILALTAFSFQVMLTGVEQFIIQLLPFASEAASLVAVTRVAPAVALFGALYFLFYSLTPSRYRGSGCAKWPGALFVTAWWLGTTALLPPVLASLGGYDLTYGGLAGVMIALIFFYLVGLGVVIGAELNAALAEGPVRGGDSAAQSEGA